MNKINFYDILFEQAQQEFQQLVQEFAEYGMEVDPDLEIRPVKGLQTYYDLTDGNIYVAMLDTSTTAGKLSKMLMRELLKCENDEELLEFLSLFQPSLIAHEMAHHLRHRYGLFDNRNLWQEEQIANQLAVAVTRHRISPARRKKAIAYLKRAIDGLSEQMKAKNIAVDSYYNIVYGLGAMGQIQEGTVDTLEIMEKLLSVSSEILFRQSGKITDSMVIRIERRNEIIDDVNREYTSNLVKYIYYHLGWIYCDLLSPRTHYLDEFVRNYLHQGIRLLPLIEIPSSVDEHHIQACYRAYRDTYNLSETARRYFYKRYRALLLAKLQEVPLNLESQSNQLKRDLSLLLEHWDDDSEDRLNYIASLVPPRLAWLFPNMIHGYVDDGVILPDDLPTETDRRLWYYTLYGDGDPAAEQTLSRLALLEEVPMYNGLPVEVMLEVAHRLYRIRLKPGETVIWEHDKNEDVYILLSGELSIFVSSEQNASFIASIQPVDVFGEMAFFTQDARSATVRASKPSECFVLKEADMHVLTSRHPIILMQMARSMAKRLAILNEEVGAARQPKFLDSIYSKLAGKRG